jgi:hypothetical protein
MAPGFGRAAAEKKAKRTAVTKRKASTRTASLRTVDGIKAEIVKVKAAAAKKVEALQERLRKLKARTSATKRVSK